MQIIIFIIFERRNVKFVMLIFSFSNY